MEKPHKSRLVHELAGVFVLAVVVLVLVALLSAAKSQGWFSRKFVFRVALPQEGAVRLGPGSEVFVLGISAGTVKKIEVGENGNVYARVQVRSDFKQYVRADSTAEIEKSFGLGGESFIEIARGTGAPLDVETGVIRCVSNPDILKQLEESLIEIRRGTSLMFSRAETTLEEWNVSGEDFRKTLTEWREMVQHLDRVATRLEQGEGTAGQLFANSELADRSNALLIESEAAIQELRHAIAPLTKGARKAPEISDAISRATEDLPALVMQMQMTLGVMEDFVKGLQRHWLVRSYMKQGKPVGRIPPVLLDKTEER